MTDDRVRDLLAEHGTTFAARAGIRLADEPAPLFQLLVLTSLLSARIRAEVAVDAARALFAAGWRTPAAMAESTWRQRVDALGRGNYKRYDESTSRQLAELTDRTNTVYGGDLRRMADEAERDEARLRELLTEFAGIGPTGAEIFCREVQDVWTWLRPYFGERALTAAGELGLPRDTARLGELVPAKDQARLAAALVSAPTGH